MIPQSSLVEGSTSLFPLKTQGISRSIFVPSKHGRGDVYSTSPSEPWNESRERTTVSCRTRLNRLHDVAHLDKPKRVSGHTNTPRGGEKEGGLNAHLSGTRCRRSVRGRRKGKTAPESPKAVRGDPVRCLTLATGFPPLSFSRSSQPIVLVVSPEEHESGPRCWSTALVTPRGTFGLLLISPCPILLISCTPPRDSYRPAIIDTPRRS